MACGWRGLMMRCVMGHCAAGQTPARPRRSQGTRSRHGYYIEDLRPGMTATFGKTVTDADILMFAGVSGDTNPVHLNQEFAVETQFQGRIAHGMLTASLISTVIGT